MARKRGVAVDDIVAAAAEIADARGLEGVTLAAVAERVGVRSPSLYAHVAGLDDLRRHLAFRAAERLERTLRQAAEGEQGVRALARLMHAYRRLALRHPGLYAAAQRAVRPGEDDELYRALGAAIVPVLAALAEAGVPADQRVHITRAIRSALHGFVVLERAGGFGMPESIDESFDRLVEMLCSGVRASAGGSSAAAG